MMVDNVTDRISAIGMLRCGSCTSPATDTIGVKPRYAKMMPPADTAPATPAKPNGAMPCAVRFAAWKNHNSTTITVSGTTNLNTMRIASCTHQPSKVGDCEPVCVSCGNQADAYCRHAVTSIAIRLENAISVISPIRYPSSAPCEYTG